MNVSSKIISSDVTIRPYPYPYEAMLAICSDLDETPDKKTYLETMRFLNTNEETAIGRGVGLEVGNTIYFDMPPNQFSYWNTDDLGREMVRNLIHSGHIDCLHSYGDLATTRKHAGHALDELTRHNCHLETWVDHGTAPTNFDGDIMKGSGDVLGSPAYHADLTLSSGVQYIWRGRVTSVIGQNTKQNLSGVWNITHPLSSGKTVLKEFTKGMLGRYGNQKYAMHADNQILQRVKLRDGQKAYEFMRCNPHWGGVSSCETANGIAEVINTKFLDHLVEKQGCCILYTHLGKELTHERIFPNKTIAAFKTLNSYLNTGKILITTTRRLLGYQRMQEEACFSIHNTRDKLTLKCSYRGPKSDLDGLSFEIPAKKHFELIVNGRITSCKWHQLNKEIKTASINWNPLVFPKLHSV
ncbi:MAG: hypothetical protein JZU65_16605 [Chlorobium sp.]|nr:hypothetical protein [Chlorobium sp.]